MNRAEVLVSAKKKTKQKKENDISVCQVNAKMDPNTRHTEAGNKIGNKRRTKDNTKTKN